MEVATKEPVKLISKKLYIGSLPYSWNVEQLEQLFSPFGRVNSTAIVSDQLTRKSKGFGFVEMENEESAAKAMSELNGREIEGRPLSVREAKPVMDRSSRDGSMNNRARYEYTDPNSTDTSGRSYGNRNGTW